MDATATRRMKWIGLAVGIAGLCVLLCYVTVLAGPRAGLVDGKFIQVACFSPLLYGLLLGAALYLMGALRRDITPLEWVPVLAVCMMTWVNTSTPFGFAPYSGATRVQISRMIPLLVGIGVVDVACGLLEKRGWSFRWKLALGLVALILAGAASEWIAETLRTVQGADRGKSKLLLWAVILGTPLMRVACGAGVAVLAGKQRAAGIALVVLGGLCLAINLMDWGLGIRGSGLMEAPNPINWIAYDAHTQSLYAAVLFLGLRALRGKPA